MNSGLDYDENSLVTSTTGLAQFQEPLDEDGHIRDKSRWAKAGEQTIEQVMNSINDFFIS